MIPGIKIYTYLYVIHFQAYKISVKERHHDQ
jgi:hypothetical protein